MAAIQLFGSGGVPFHKDKHCYLVFEELYFDRGVRADVVQSVENGAVDRLLGLARANVPALTVAPLPYARQQFCSHAGVRVRRPGVQAADQAEHSR